ncbi:MAG TPA: Gfo/Idh/MocA family oxidoreductase [Candidatus Paceibacterota bacterium]
MRVALIGYTGYWGEKLARALGGTGHLITDWIDSKNSSAIEDVEADVAFIATPPETHYDLAMRCMKVGLDVMVEKPMAMKASHAQAMYEFADSNGVVLAVDSTFVHTRAFDFLKNKGMPLISYQSLRLAPPMPQAKINAGWDLIVHDLSILQALGVIDQDCSLTGTEDGSVAQASLSLPTGGSAFITASRAWYHKVRDIVLHYPDATYLWTLDGLFDAATSQLVANEVGEPLKAMIADFDHRCRNRLIEGITDGYHGSQTVRCLERLFPAGSSLGIRPSGMGNGLHRRYPGQPISVPNR